MVFELLELICNVVFSFVVFLIALCKFLSVSLCDTLMQCSVIPRMSMSKLTCSFAIKEMCCWYWVVPRPFRF